jgi:hypothetical protein
LKTLDPDAAAHMSLHLNQQCQRAQNTDAQLNLPFTGGAQRRQFDDHRDNHPVNRCGETPLRTTQPTVKQFLQFFDNPTTNPQKSHTFP